MYTVGQIADHIDGYVVGNRSVKISSIGSIHSANSGQIAHLSNPQYRQYLASTNASAVILTESDQAQCPTVAVVVDHPYVAYAKTSQLFDKRPRVPIGVHETAFIDASANLGEDVRIGPFVTVGAESNIGDRVEIFDHASIGGGCSIGADTVLKSHVTLSHDIHVGDRCLLMEGCVIGSNGFGYASEGNQRNEPIAQLGGVRIGNDVDVGAKTTIDRGALEDTVIGNLVKMDDQVHIGHNCQIGDRTIICGCAGMAGSVTIGKDCMIGGGVGIAGDGPLELTDMVYVSAMTFVSRSIDKPGIYSGHTLHSSNSKWRRNAIRLNDLDALHKKVDRLERQIKELLAE
ncbi:MAG: UDP-3-O-(3-hydroxymyristoyl)glucosamine N-acyltransferase [Gammaproteobacteria bacterium]|nr:UDP-3-O-(3-hydroxymyristoyl)glucosamine N-acyltransferase [Gammaproteobacteria bacterium]